MDRTPLQHNRSYLSLVSGYLATDFGASMAVFTFPLVATASGASAAAAGAVGFGYAAGNAACLLPAGAQVDRSDRRVVMIMSSGVASALFGSLTFAAVFAQLTFMHLFVVAALAGVANAYMVPAEASALRFLVPADQLGTALSVNQARQMAASLLAAPVGGVLLSESETTLFGVVMAAFAAGACMVALVRVRMSTKDGTGRRIEWIEISSGIKWLFGHPAIRVTVLCAAAMNMAVAGFTVSLILGLQAEGMHPATIGLLNTVAATAGLCGALVSPWLIKRIPTGVLILVQGTTLSVACLAVPFVHSWLMIAVCLAVSVLLLPAANAAVIGYQMAVVPASLQGRVTSSATFLTAVSRPLGPLAAGLLLESYGGRTALLAFATLIVVATAAQAMTRSVRDIP